MTKAATRPHTAAATEPGEPASPDDAIAEAIAAGKLLVQPYARWAAQQGIPIIEDFAVDLLAVETAPWDRLGARAALVHVAGRGDWSNIVVTELSAGKATEPQRHLYEEVPGRHMWETNFVPDLADFELPAWAARGAGSRNLKFVLADATMHAHVSEMPVGTYKKGHRHHPDFHVFTVTGHGYSLLWYEGDEEFTRINWRHGVVYAPADQQFHQHFNTAAHPTRYLAVAYGGLRYPFTEERRQHFLGVDKSVSEGGRQIDYADEDPRIRVLYEKELAVSGLTCAMPPVTGRAHP